MQDTSESEINTIRIEDISPETMANFLEFLYLDDCEVLRTGTDVGALEELLGAGDKYDVAALKYQCGRRLSQLVDIEEMINIVEMINIAERYGAEYLLEFCVRGVANNFEKAMAAKEWWEEVELSTVNRVLKAKKSLG